MPENTYPDFSEKTGKLNYTMKNDYLFKVVLQADSVVLSALIASLLHMPRNEILSVDVQNPIEPGESIMTKTFILDIKVLLNRNKIVNLEMQVCDEDNWRERSLGYLCRSFDNLNKGEDYINTKPAIHIGFIDFDIPGIPPELYGSYQLLNVKNHTQYSDKFTLCMVELNHIELATEEDKTHGIDRWVRFFKAATWEEIKMLAKNDEVMERAGGLIMRYADEDTRTREALQAREDAINRERAKKAREQRMEQELRQAREDIINRERAKKELEQRMEQELRQAQEDIANSERSKMELEQRLEQELLDTKTALSERDALINRLTEEIEHLRRIAK